MGGLWVGGRAPVGGVTVVGGQAREWGEDRWGGTGTGGRPILAPFREGEEAKRLGKQGSRAQAFMGGVYTGAEGGSVHSTDGHSQRR